MQRRGLSASQRFEVSGCAVTFVSCQVEAWVACVQLLHHRIAAGLGEDGCGTDGGDGCVAFDDGFDCAAQVEVINTGQLISVDLDVRGTNWQTQQRPAHRQERRAQDVETVDFVAIGWGPIFNAADVCVVVGVAILTWRLLADGRGPASA